MCFHDIVNEDGIELGYVCNVLVPFSSFVCRPFSLFPKVSIVVSADRPRPRLDFGMFISDGSIPVSRVSKCVCGRDVSGRASGYCLHTKILITTT